MNKIYVDHCDIYEFEAREYPVGYHYSLPTQLYHVQHNYVNA